MKKSHKKAMLKWYGTLLGLASTFGIVACFHFIPENIFEKFKWLFLILVGAYSAFWMFLLYKCAGDKDFIEWQNYCEKKNRENQDKIVRRLKLAALIWGIIEVILVILTAKFVYTEPPLDTIRLTIFMTVLISCCAYGAYLFYYFVTLYDKKQERLKKTVSSDEITQKEAE